MPTGIALRDVREQLFAAAERVLLRDGPHSLTGRAVTAEAGCAKGVLYKHFADFDEFLTELVIDRTARLQVEARGLIAQAGTGTVVGNLRVALEKLFGSVAVAIVGLITFRDDLRARLRAMRDVRGLPLLTEAAAMITSYLEAERDLRRVVPDADLPSVAGMLIGTGHLMFADRGSTPPSDAEVERLLFVALAGVLR
ncbi:TetR/AcrR family transcriptional regulator [Actinoplanes sp. NPDC051513]|uniref:TetR/AcrR family transcriptional regulator n=1 Tax=Actinoplanes sp. NPDC051513 TaxID=3363908 RepID=UPI00378E586A